MIYKELCEADQLTETDFGEKTITYLDDDGLLMGRDGLFRNGLNNLGHHHGQSFLGLWTSELSNRFPRFAFRSRLTLAGAVKDDHSTTSDR